MTKQRPGLTRAQHQIIGSELRRAHASLTTLIVVAANGYGKSHPRVSKVMRAAQRAIKALGDARSEMEELLADHHADWKTSDYYGGLREESLSTLLEETNKTIWTAAELLAADFPAPDKPPRGTLKPRILQHIAQHGTATRADLLSALGCRPGVLDSAVMDLELDGYIEAVGTHYRVRVYGDQT